ncbi:hypothetical protein TYRP_017337 [Tyrophagus putrescentiae]|nr:hypothetical protein TYRP_017337 [Tyrophagus putrescentiae]
MGGKKFGFVAPFGTAWTSTRRWRLADALRRTFSLITCNHLCRRGLYDASLPRQGSGCCSSRGGRVCDSWEDYASKKCPMYDSEKGWTAAPSFPSRLPSRTKPGVRISWSASITGVVPPIGRARPDLLLLMQPKPHHSTFRTSSTPPRLRPYPRVIFTS